MVLTVGINIPVFEMQKAIWFCKAQSDDVPDPERLTVSMFPIYFPSRLKAWALMLPLGIKRVCCSILRIFEAKVKVRSEDEEVNPISESVHADPESLSQVSKSEFVKVSVLKL